MKNKNRPRREARKPKRSTPVPFKPKLSHTLLYTRTLPVSPARFIWDERGWDQNGSVHTWKFVYDIEPTRTGYIEWECKPNYKINRSKPPHQRLEYDLETVALPLNWEII